MVGEGAGWGDTSLQWSDVAHEAGWMEIIVFTFIIIIIAWIILIFSLHNNNNIDDDDDNGSRFILYI